MYTPIQSVKVFEQVAEQIEKRILVGELRSGDRLPTERELAEQFHVSRTAVREAMKNLAQKGLVDMRPGQRHDCHRWRARGFAGFARPGYEIEVGRGRRLG